MPLRARFLAVVLPLCLAGCNGAFWGNVFAVGLTFGIFFGTLSLGRRNSSDATRSDASQTTRR